MFIKYRLSNHPRDHPRQWYADLRVPLVSVLFKKNEGGGGRVWGACLIVIWPRRWVLVLGRAPIRAQALFRGNTISVYWNCSVPRFQPDQGFAGTDRSQRRDGPVQFEKEEEDPFGLDKFLTEAKKGKRPLDEPSRSRLVCSSPISGDLLTSFLFLTCKCLGKYSFYFWRQKTRF